jgi:hypothetical protein
VALLLLEVEPPPAGDQQGPVAALVPGFHAVPRPGTKMAASCNAHPAAGL